METLLFNLLFTDSLLGSTVWNYIIASERLRNSKIFWYLKKTCEITVLI